MPHTPGGTKYFVPLKPLKRGRLGVSGPRPSPTSLATPSRSLPISGAQTGSLGPACTSQQGSGECEGGRTGIHDVAGCGERRPCEGREEFGSFGLVAGFRKGSCGGYIREVHWSAELMGGVVLVDTARSGQVPHTPGGTEVASVDLRTLR